jgi:splicing factor 3B subunit 3
MLDYDTIAGADKFGNVFINHLDSDASNQSDMDLSSSARSSAQASMHKTNLVAHFHVGDVITALQKVQLAVGAPEVLYTGLHGTVGILVPLATKGDVEFLMNLEQHMRVVDADEGRRSGPSLVGRDHLAYRGYYVPVKSVMDGDLCEEFTRLPKTKQSVIAGELNRDVGEVLKKLEGLRAVASGM